MTALIVIAVVWAVGLAVVWSLCAAGADDNEHTGPRQ